MANQVLLKKSSVAARVPTTSDLAYGEVALNYTDGKLYYKDSSNNIKYFLESAQTEATLDDVVTNGATTTTTAVIPFYYANQSNFPNATTYHGAIAHSHSDGAMYFAHGGSWNKLANDSQLASYQTISGLNAAIDSHLNQSNPTAGYVLSWNGTDYDWVDNAGYTDNDVDTHLNTSTASSGQILTWNGTDYDWVTAAASGIALTDLSVTTAAAGTASLSYNNTNGVFTYTPPDLSSYLTSETITSIALNGNSLDYTDELGNTTNISLAAYLDDTTNTVLSASLSGNTVTFTREDSTTFTLDVSNLYDDTNLVTSVNGQTGAVTGLLETSDIGSTVLAYDSNLQSFVTTFTLPTVDGSNGQVITTDGSGNLSFTTVSGSSGGNSASELSITSDTFTGDNSTTNYTLSQVAASDTHVIVSLNGVVQDPSEYSVTGSTLSFSTAPALNDNVELRTFSRDTANITLRDYQKYIYTITSTTSTVSGVDDNGNTLAYDVGYVDVYQNGIRLVAGDDYTATTGTSVTFTDAALNTDTVEILSYGRAYIYDPRYVWQPATVELTTTSQAVISTFNASDYDSAKYILQATITGEIHMTEVAVMHDGTDVFTTEYGTMWSGSASLGTVTADLSSGNIRLLFTPANANTTVKIKRVLI